MAGWNDVTGPGWDGPDGTPAPQGPADQVDEASAAGDLAAMFGGNQAAADLNAWTAPTPDGATAPDGHEPVEADADADDADDLFTDLFGDDADVDAAAPLSTAGAASDAVPTEPAAEADGGDVTSWDVAARQGSVPSDAPGVDLDAWTTADTSAEGDDDGQGATGDASAADASESDDAAAVGAPVTDAPEAKQRLSIADKRARQEAAGADSDHGSLEQVGLETWGAQRYLEADRLWGYVNQILGYMSAEHDLQLQVGDIAITRDHTTDAEQRRTLEALVGPRLVDANVTLNNPADLPLVWDMLYDELTGISVLGPLWRDDDVTEIMVDAWDRIVIERDGALQLTPIRFRDPQHALEVARNLSQKVSDRSVNESNPIATAELPGARLHFVVGKVCKTGLSISIRKFRPLMGIEQLLEFGALSREMAEFLADAIGKGRANVLVSGGTGTGKTTMLNAISSFIPTTERVVTIEDAFELTLQNELVVPMQTKEAGHADSRSSVDMAELLRSSLRMRPDRIVVGEIRGPEAQVMLAAANTGHDGTMSTVHANDPTGCLSFRLPDMLMQARDMPEKVARRQVAGAVDLVIQISRRAGRRFVSGIAEVDVTDLGDDGIAPHLLFDGDLDDDGRTVHRRVGALRTDTDLAIKMADYGADVARWSAPPHKD